MGPCEEQPGNVGKKIYVTSERTRFLRQDEIRSLLQECEKQVTSPWLLPLVTLASHLVMAGVDLITVKELLGHKTINMTNRYTHLAQEHKAQAVAKLEERYKPDDTGTQDQRAIVSPELKQAIGAVLTPNLEQNRNIFLVRGGRGLGLLNDFKQDLEAASGFEPLHRGFADLSLNHLGTPPSEDR